MTDTVERFSNRVENYVKYRPQYPREIIDHLKKNCGLTNDTVVADIGCGTGVSSQLFLENGNPVFGVEPNAAMRLACAEHLARFSNFRLQNGTSTETGLPDASVDLVVAAQAFHWFDPKPTGREFLRILRPGGYILLMWNERQIDTTPFLRDYEAFLLKYAHDYGAVRHENINEIKLKQFFSTAFSSARFANAQIFDFDSLKGRMFSASYMPDEKSDGIDEMIEELKSIFAKHQENDRIGILYDTNVYFAKF